MKIHMTIITGGVGGDSTDTNPVLSVEAQIAADAAAAAAAEAALVVTPTPVVVVEESEVVLDTVPEVVPTVPDVVAETPPQVVEEVVFVEPTPEPPPVYVPPPPVYIPPPPVVGRTIHELPTLTISNPEMYVTFAGMANDSNFTEQEADAIFDFKWDTFNAKQSQILNGKWNVTVPKDEIKKGIHAAKDLAGKNEYYFGYEIEFDTGYDLADNNGGKLPGLIGLNKALKSSGGNQVYPDGCSALGQRRDEGFSLRSMWRKNGRMIGYFYHEDNPEMLPGGNNSCGHEVDYIHEGEKVYLQKGKKYYIETRCKMNSKYASNGIVQIWCNGFLVVSMTNMRFSHSLLYNINHMFIYFWHGGSSSTWEPSKDSTVRFDNFVLQTTPISH